ncbi:cysteine--tRNA ligase [Methylocapsa palsarum]|uniref:Cysteine--tRNA ligase n=1 Tax=Methylocapsa palsarum TaxID=1612308 RepID=A0A1I3ZQZ4_9HYPH|nr:cysteine--tRNA ligase [Methylocapsa palsarum]SFK46091.1 cysteinyl-tRNA synthetase [Methylocapsa palsarum]
MPLRLYNTLTRNKTDFVPIDESNVRLYACGPTVYDHLHIGNGRMLIVFDQLFRLLRHVYGADHVKYVRNITDVDDKINQRAKERGIDIRVLTDEMTKIFHEDAAALGCLPPNVEPRATKHMAQMTAIIEKLIAKGNAYEAQGHVLFDVPSMPDYGQLSRRPLDDMIAGARVEVAPYKRGPMDFVLWKPSKAVEPGWESPWGRGRPGWHIECSAMSWTHLGETFDIHGGGIDLVFPHHENEVAQTRCAFGHDVMANIWMHNGHLQVEGEKMSKSLGNFRTIRDVVADWPGEAVRLTMLKTHYRQPIDLTISSLRESQKELDRWYPLAKQFAASPAMIAEDFLQALSDDMNTPDAITSLRRLYKEASDEVAFAGTRLASCGHLLGLFESSMAEWTHWKPAGLAIDELHVARLINARLAARKNKNFAESDRIRDELDAMGVALKDNKDGTTTWEPKR